jgi:hypothetical protein
MARTAECACRSLKVRVEAEPIVVGACNCTQCQRRSGSVFAVVAYFPKDNVQVVSGAYKTFDYTADSGRKGEMHFCPECGSTVFWDAEYRRDLRGVAVGCFADPTFLRRNRPLTTEAVILGSPSLQGLSCTTQLRSRQRTPSSRQSTQSPTTERRAKIRCAKTNPLRVGDAINGIAKNKPTSLIRRTNGATP